MKRFLLLFPVLLLLTGARANGIQISGRVLDADQRPIELAVVTLLKAQDSSLVKGAMSGADGRYVFEDIAPGRYLVAASMPGYTKTMSAPFEPQESTPAVVPDLTLSAGKEMKEVTISAARPLYVQRPDKLIMNVENSPVRITGTAWDLLSTAPGVVVDQNGNISLRGKSGVKIYVDGKNTFLSGDQLQNFLQNIPATDVVQIEIISNPSAKYDAEGSGGIINIITRKGSQQGFNASVRAGYGQAFYVRSEAGLDCNYAKEKFNVYAKYNFFDNSNVSRVYIDRNIPYNGDTTNFNQHTFTHETGLGHRATLGVDFYAKHDITWGMRLDGALVDGTQHTANSTLISVTGQDTANLLDQWNNSTSFYDNGAANLYFRQQYDTSGREFSASVDYLAYRFGADDHFDLHYSNNYGMTTAGEELQRNQTESNIRILVGQADYSHPFSKKYKLETGLKSSYVETANDLHFSLWQNNRWENDTTRSNSFIYKEQINAVYANGYADYGKWQLELGLRAEQTISDGNSPTTGQHLRRSYLQLFPSIFILQKIGKKSSLNYTFSRRVNRPAYDNLNPFKYYLDQYTYELGNPYLQPEIANTAEITYSFMDALFFTVGGSRTKHAMTDVTNQVDSTGVGYKTTVNLSNVDNAYFGLSCPVPLGNWFMMEVQLNESYNHYKSDLYGILYDQQSWMFNGSANATFSLPQNWKVQLWGWYQSPGYYGIFRLESRGGVGAGLSKSFFEKKLSFNLTVQDIFHTTGMRSHIDFGTQHAYLQFTPDTPRMYLRVRYAFGNSKANRKIQSKSGADELKDRTGK